MPHYNVLLQAAMKTQSETSRSRQVWIKTETPTVASVSATIHTEHRKLVISEINFCTLDLTNSKQTGSSTNTTNSI